MTDESASRLPRHRSPRPGSWSQRLFRWTAFAAGAVFLVLATIALLGGVEARHLADLEAWHRFAPQAEVTARDIDAGMTLDEYLRREERVLAEVRERLEPALAGNPREQFNRYRPGSRAHPSAYPVDGNRTFERVPAEIRGGALLIHGLTDSPYSMRAIAEILHRRGYYTLAPRMPGHGTTPAALTVAEWHDWLAVVRMSVRHVRSRIGAGRPLVLVGYSSGGALAVEYTLEALDASGEARADRLVLLSPMIGVKPTARLSKLVSALGFVPYFEKARWLEVYPEYNPFKYTSFPAHAAAQTAGLTREIDRRLASLAGRGRMSEFPPVLTFQSVVDATVSTPAVVERLYDRLPANGSELVLFDVNRLGWLEPFVKSEVARRIAAVLEPRERHYALAVVTNAFPDRLEVEERRARPGAHTATHRPLGLAWPDGVFSLSHVALPFPLDDPLYGLDAVQIPGGPVALGALSPRGEREVLEITVEDLTRTKSNPFFPYLAERLAGWVDPEIATTMHELPHSDPLARP